MLPVIELRGAIPLGISLGIPPWEAFALALIGNLIPVPALLLILEPVCRAIRGWPPVRTYIDSLFARSHKRGIHLRRWGLIGLTLFVSVPIPTTGVWSGSLIASLMGFKMWPSALALSVGAIIAGVIVTVLSWWGILGYG